jgi:clan AA aspartic protease (TIGR02281 family)
VLVRAQEICRKYGKAAAIDSERYGVVLPGGSIDEMSFSCRTVEQSPRASIPDATSDLSPVLSESNHGEVRLVSENGVFSVPVVINRAITLNFLVDSGASDVAIPKDVVLTLLRTGTLNDSDFFGRAVYRLADGSLIPSMRFRIRSLRVGSFEVNNVIGSVANADANLLLGQSFLDHFTSWSIDNRHHTLLLTR